MKPKEETKILIVDDLPENLVAFSAILKQEKYKVETASSGAETIKKTKGTDFDIFLLDVQMPDMDGFELAQILRNQKHTSEIPVIFLTAHDDDTFKKLKGYNTQALDYIIKPVNTELLILKIKNFIRISDTQKQLKEANRILKEKAKDSHIFYESLFFNSPDEIFILDQNGIIVKINRSGKLSMGSYTSEIIGKHFSEVPFNFSINNSLTPHKLFESLMDNGSKGEITELKVIDNHANIIYYEIKGNIFHTAELERFLQLNIRNVTAKVEAEEKTKASEIFIRGILNSLTSPIAVIDKNGFILQINNSWLEYLKDTNGSCLMKAHKGDNYLQMCNNLTGKCKNTGTEILNGINTVLNKEASQFQSEYSIILNNNERRFLFTVNKYWDDSPQVVIRHVDVTKTREMERKLSEKNKELELFMYRASHDLKGPLSTSKGLLSLALAECSDINISQYLNLLQKSNTKLENILTDLMEIVIIREGLVEKRETNLTELLKDVIETKGEAGEKINEIKMIYNIDVKEKIITDSKLLKIALRNIINNAIKYSKKDFPDSYVNTSAFIADDNLILKVTDNGIGIPDEFLHKVFDMFFRATDSSSGTGLGLFITKNAIEKLNGNIQIESKLRSGTIVTLKLPYK